MIKRIALVGCRGAQRTCHQCGRLFAICVACDQAYCTASCRTLGPDAARSASPVGSDFERRTVTTTVVAVAEVDDGRSRGRRPRCDGEHRGTAGRRSCRRLGRGARRSSGRSRSRPLRRGRGQVGAAARYVDSVRSPKPSSACRVSGPIGAAVPASEREAQHVEARASHAGEPQPHEDKPAPEPVPRTEGARQKAGKATPRQDRLDTPADERRDRNREMTAKSTANVAVP